MAHKITIYTYYSALHTTAATFENETLKICFTDYLWSILTMYTIILVAFVDFISRPGALALHNFFFHFLSFRSFFLMIYKYHKILYYNLIMWFNSVYKMRSHLTIRSYITHTTNHFSPEMKNITKK